MRAHEFIFESDKAANGKRLSSTQQDSIKGAISLPDASMNKANGSPYMAWRFGIAMAGSPDFPTPDNGAMAGDPILTTYTDVDLEIINKAAEAVGVGKINKITRNTSSELKTTQTASPINPFKGYKK